MGLVERGKEIQELDVPRPAAKTRDLFGVQLEVTSLLLEAERRKLAVLQRELQSALAEGGSVKVKEKQRQELLHAILKIQVQHQRLDKEYRIHAAGILLFNSRAFGKITSLHPGHDVRKEIQLCTFKRITFSCWRSPHWEKIGRTDLPNLPSVALPMVGAAALPSWGIRLPKLGE